MLPLPLGNTIGMKVCPCSAVVFSVGGKFRINIQMNTRTQGFLAKQSSKSITLPSCLAITIWPLADSLRSLPHFLPSSHHHQLTVGAQYIPHSDRCYCNEIINVISFTCQWFWFYDWSMYKVKKSLYCSLIFRFKPLKEVFSTLACRGIGKKPL